MLKQQIVIRFVLVIVFAVICGTYIAAQEYETVEDKIMDFYKTKEYEKAPELLEAFLNEDRLDSAASWYYPMVFFFSKLFPSEESFNRFMTVYDKSDRKRKQFLIPVIGLKDKQFLKQLYEKENDTYLKGFIKTIIDDKTGYDPLTADITNATELDILWSIFFATGEAAPIRKIASVLAWDDMFKNKIEEYEGDIQQKRELEELLSCFDIEYKNGKPAALMSDCDISILDKHTEHPENFKKLIATLHIADEELYRSAIKYAAFWSLSANLNRHEPVRTECIRIADDKTAPERIVMLFVLVKSTMY